MVSTRSLRIVPNVEVVDKFELGGQALREITLATILCLPIGETAFRLSIFCRHHIFALLANATITMTLFFFVSAIFLGTDDHGRRSVRLARLGWVRWLMLIIGPIATSLIIRH